MLHLVTSALSLTVGMSPVATSSRVSGALMVESLERKACYDRNQGSLPASVSMAGATPVFVGGDGFEKYIGGSTLHEKEEMSGWGSGFVYEDRTPLGQAIGCVVPTAGKVPSKGAMLKPMDFN